MPVELDKSSELPAQLKAINQMCEFERSRMNSSDRQTVDFYRGKVKPTIMPTPSGTLPNKD